MGKQNAINEEEFLSSISVVCMSLHTYLQFTVLYFTMYLLHFMHHLRVHTTNKRGSTYGSSQQQEPPQELTLFPLRTASPPAPMPLALMPGQLFMGLCPQTQHSRSSLHFCPQPLAWRLHIKLISLSDWRWQDSPEPTHNVVVKVLHVGRLVLFLLDLEDLAGLLPLPLLHLSGLLLDACCNRPCSHTSHAVVSTA